MKIQEIKSKGTLWATGKGCELYIIIKSDGFEWWMISPTTGKHMIKNKGNKGQAQPCERVLAHWNGFQLNQSK
jgi:hypothetical protein